MKREERRGKNEKEGRTKREEGTKHQTSIALTNDSINLRNSSITSWVFLDSDCLPSSFFRLHSSVFVLPSSFFRLPSSLFGLPSSVRCLLRKSIPMRRRRDNDRNAGRRRRGFTVSTFLVIATPMFVLMIGLAVEVALVNVTRERLKARLTPPRWRPRPSCSIPIRSCPPPSSTRPPRNRTPTPPPCSTAI